MKCNTKDMFIWYTRVAKNSIKEDEHVHKLFYYKSIIQALIWSWARRNWSLFKRRTQTTEIARRLGRNRSTISREINRGSITQVKKVNGQKFYYQHYYADDAHNRYRHAREASYYLKLDRVSDDFLTKFTEAMREKPRVGTAPQ